MILVVLPAYNEEAALEPLLREIEAIGPRCPMPVQTLVVDDCSTDRTLEIARSWSGSMPVHVEHHERNRGLGGALQTGLRKASDPNMGADIIVTMDADLTHSPNYIPEMIEPILADKKDVIIASRYASGGKETGVPLGRKVLSHGAAFTYGFLAAIKDVQDYSCGYRAMRANLVREAFEALGKEFISETGFQATGEIVLKLRHFGARFGEVGFELRYDLKGGVSKMRKFKTARDTMILLLRHGRFGRKPRALKD